MNSGIQGWGVKWSSSLRESCLIEAWKRICFSDLSCLMVELSCREVSCLMSMIVLNIASCVLLFNSGHTWGLYLAVSTISTVTTKQYLPCVSCMLLDITMVIPNNLSHFQQNFLYDYIPEKRMFSGILCFRQQRSRRRVGFRRRITISLSAR